MSKVELITKELGKHLLVQIEKASSICILTSFVMKSGVDFLKNALKAAARRGADIKICTGDYLYVTQPEGLFLLLMIEFKFVYGRVMVYRFTQRPISFKTGSRNAYLLAHSIYQNLHLIRVLNGIFPSATINKFLLRRLTSF
ncbi:hypothetical protein J2Y67_002131 [Neobacillus niacini]|nr:hypothetical protein [Neobacillus niacini]